MRFFDEIMRTIDKNGLAKSFYRQQNYGMAIELAEKDLGIELPLNDFADIINHMYGKGE